MPGAPCSSDRSTDYAIPRSAELELSPKSMVAGWRTSRPSEMRDVEIAWLVDPDSRLFASDRGREELAGNTPECVQDFRRVLDDKTLDAVSIVTPDHWHALMTIWACQAGKDVHVEKPRSHNIAEGRKIVGAARKLENAAAIQIAAWACRGAPALRHNPYVTKRGASPRGYHALMNSSRNHASSFGEPEIVCQGIALSLAATRRGPACGTGGGSGPWPA